MDELCAISLLLLLLCTPNRRENELDHFVTSLGPATEAILVLVHKDNAMLVVFVPEDPKARRRQVQRRPLHEAAGYGSGLHRGPRLGHALG
jgi:hypothetical protein